MAAKRSPRYPAISLKDAVEKAMTLYEKEGGSVMGREVIAQNLGYKGLSGASIPVISALLKYGLLEGRADEIRLSDDAIKIIAEAEADDQRDRAAALRRALVSDSVFAELHERFGDSGSEGNIRAYLTKSGFNKEAASKASRAFIESEGFVKSEAGAYNNQHETAEFGDSASPPVGSAPRGGGRNDGGFPLSGKVNMQVDRFNLDEGEVILQWPKQLSRVSYEELDQWLKLILGRAKRLGTAPQERPSSDPEPDGTSEGS